MSSISSNHPAHADAVDGSLVDVFHHVHGGDNGEVAVGGYLLEGVAHVFAHLADVAAGSLFVGGLFVEGLAVEGLAVEGLAVGEFEDGEEIVGGGGMAVDDFLHGGIPGHGDGGRVGHLRGVGEPTALHIGLLDVGHVGETDASAVDAEEKEVAGVGHVLEVGEVGIAHAAEILLGEDLTLLLGGHG